MTKDQKFSFVEGKGNTVPSADKIHPWGGGCRSSGSCQVHIRFSLTLILGSFWVVLKSLRFFLFVCFLIFFNL